MLIVSRRKGQRIVLGHDIEIVITDISRSGVKVGIVAPGSLSILRGEVRDAVEQANREALASSFDEPNPAPEPATPRPVSSAESAAGVSSEPLAGADVAPATLQR